MFIQHAHAPTGLMTAEAPNAPARNQPRIPALDFTKGTLVLVMVLYHWLNYFVSTEGNFYTYLRFLTPSFIFISGFVISHVYVVAYGLGDAHVPSRLMRRGFKLLVLFTLLNVLKVVLIPNRGGVTSPEPWAVGNLVTVFVTGNVGVDGNSKATAFNILVPISYLLMLSAGLVTLSRFYKYIFHAVCALSLFSISVLNMNGLASGHLELIAIGLLGVILGYAPIEATRRLVAHPLAIAAAYILYLAALHVWGINYPLQLVGVCLNLLLFYMVGESNRGLHTVRDHVILLGKYSLFGYIAQIVILQALHEGLERVDLGSATPAVSFLAAFALTSLAVEAAELMRARMHVANTLYKAVFA